jgi:hypothetical protein
MGSARERDQFGALVHSFLARFFENEITSGTDDLKNSFFWLLAFLMAPGLFMPFVLSFDWEMIARFRGPEVLQVLSRGDKAFYIGFAMVASALIGAIAWSSLLMDRLDGLILGALPVRPAVVVRAKLAALGVYILLIAIGMHTLSAVAFGTLLSNHAAFAFMVRSIAAHFIVPCAASAFVVLAIAGVQGTALALTGPRVFVRLSAVLQLGLVALIILGLLALPILEVSVVGTLRGTGRNVRPWLLYTPPLWFLGAYEWILGANDPGLMALARRAFVALLAAAALTVTSYPIAYRRLMTSAVEGSGGTRRTGVLAGVGDSLTRLIARAPQHRAVSQFFLESLGRVDRLRFVMASALGIAGAWGLPAWFALITDPAGATLARLWSAQLAGMTFLLAGLRLAAALPADVNAGWLFDARAPSRRQVHAALERVMFVLGVLPVAVAGVPVHWWLLERLPPSTGPGDPVALVIAIQASVTLAAGVLLIQMLLWRFEGVPCARLWEPERLKLGRRWALYVAAFVVFTSGIPFVSRLFVSVPGRGIWFAVGLVAVAAGVRFRSLRQPPRVVDDVDAVTGGLLNLE